METTRADVACRLRSIVVEVLGVKASEVLEDASFADDLGADSPAISQLSTMIEEEFDIFITDESFGKLVTFGDAVEFIIASQILT
ncbi:acyl carrier protein (plasmid) [Ensifer adhaerens]|uniref:acyl carrier protein n=1 Tax=Ensifer adhaerens TaxID=106592 RepID=UPI0023A95FBA|nr:acyl carrier protein [Ensifer adhaerens]WDZ79321.1 acyl carrier protein [Ensifer adhaerens]